LALAPVIKLQHLPDKLSKSGKPLKFQGFFIAAKQQGVQTCYTSGFWKSAMPTATFHHATFTVEYAYVRHQTRDS
jgi:nitroreductase